MHAVQGGLTEEKGLNILYLARITHQRNITDLPSRVPNFSRDISTNPFGIVDRGEKFTPRLEGPAPLTCCLVSGLRGDI